MAAATTLSNKAGGGMAAICYLAAVVEMTEPTNVKCGAYLTKSFASNRLHKKTVVDAKPNSIIGLLEISGAQKCLHIRRLPIRLRHPGFRRRSGHAFVSSVTASAPSRPTWIELDDLISILASRILMVLAGISNRWRPGKFGLLRGIPLGSQ